MQITREQCPACGATTSELAQVHSEFSDLDFAFRRCEACGLSFVANPRVDFADLYDGEYYAGRGADTFIDYIGEMERPGTVREYEWRGITTAVTSLTSGSDVKWLDYGCGLGGLVRFARQHGLTQVYGFDEGWSTAWMADHGLPVLSREELVEQAGQFDVVTAIEVIEHVTDPFEVMSHIASLLKPGGLFFLTTGNAEPHRDELTSWRYVHPDVHIAYFEPRTLELLYRRCGLEPYRAGFVPGLDDIIRYKVLKTIGVRSQNWLERMIPWSLASRVVDRRHKVSAQPLARRPAPDDDAGAAGGREVIGREDADRTSDGPETFQYVGDLVDVDTCDLPAMKARFLVERVPHGATVLDVGCGGGKMLRTVAAHRSDVVLLGCDIREPEVADDFSFALVDAADAHLPYDDASVDVVLMIDVLEHLYEPAKVLSEVDRVLRPGGRLLVFVPVEGEPVGFYALFRRLFGQDLYAETKEHVQAFRYRDVDELLAGFEVAEREYAYHPLGQLMDATLCAGLRFGPVRRLFWRSSPYHGSGAARGSLVGGVFGRLMRWANALAWGESRLLHRVRLGSAGVLIDARRPGAP